MPRSRPGVSFAAPSSTASASWPQAGGPITVACTQEAPVFSEIADEGGNAALTFVNIRENAGWSRDAAKAGPKIAALLAAAAEPLPDIPYVTLIERRRHPDLWPRREGDRGRRAAEGSSRRHRADHQAVRTSRRAAPPNFRWCRARSAPPRAISALSRSPSTIMPLRRRPRAARSCSHAARDGAISRCDLILDLSGGAALFPAADLRDGYLRADPGDPPAMLRAVLRARDLVGTFDKPRYVEFKADLCAHSRSKIVGCRRCLDLCPTGAITPDGDHVAIDRVDLRRLRTMRGRLPDRRCGLCFAAGRRADAQAAHAACDLSRIRRRQCRAAVARSGAWRRIDRCAGASRRRPAGKRDPGRSQRSDADRARNHRGRFAYGATAIRFLLRARAAPRCRGAQAHHRAGRSDPCGLGFGAGRVATIETDDPDALGETLRAIAARAGRDNSRQASCRSAASATCSVWLCANCIARRRRRSMSSRLPAGAPFGEGRDQCRGLHAVSGLRLRLPDRARCRPIPSGRCCASRKTPACNAGCARRPVRRK